MKGWLRRDGGQAVVEFALILPLIAIFLLGMMQVGFALNARQQLEGVARQGARTFALTGDGPATATAVQLAGRQIAQFGRADFVMEATIGATGMVRINTTVDNAANTLRNYRLAFARARGDWVTVTLTHHYPNPIQASVFGFRLPATIPLRTSATARIEFDSAQGAP